MSRFEERARALRARTDMHINCAQTVLLTFAAEFGIEEETALRLCRHFGGGMRMGAACGAFTGGLMVLGLAGLDNEALKSFTARFRELQDGRLECRELLLFNKDNGGDKKAFCDGLVFGSVALLETLLRERGIIE